jgi:hypothetical protein
VSIRFIIIKLLSSSSSSTTLLLLLLLLVLLLTLGNNNCPSNDLTAFTSMYSIPSYTSTATYSFASTGLLKTTDFNGITSAVNDITNDISGGIKRSSDSYTSYLKGCNDFLCYGMLKDAPLLRDFSATLNITSRSSTPYSGIILRSSRTDFASQFQMNFLILSGRLSFSIDSRFTNVSYLGWSGLNEFSLGSSNVVGGAGIVVLKVTKVSNTVTLSVDGIDSITYSACYLGSLVGYPGVAVGPYASASALKIDAVVPPTVAPSTQPTMNPTPQPSLVPSYQPTPSPSTQPTMNPTPQPSLVPSYQPSTAPSPQPSFQPTLIPTVAPSAAPTRIPTTIPTLNRQTACISGYFNYCNNYYYHYYYHLIIDLKVPIL